MLLLLLWIGGATVTVNEASIPGFSHEEEPCVCEGNKYGETVQEQRRCSGEVCIFASKTFLAPDFIKSPGAFPEIDKTARRRYPIGQPLTEDDCRNPSRNNADNVNERSYCRWTYEVDYDPKARSSKCSEVPVGDLLVQCEPLSYELKVLRCGDVACTTTKEDIEDIVVGCYAIPRSTKVPNKWPRELDLDEFQLDYKIKIDMVESKFLKLDNKYCDDRDNSPCDYQLKAKICVKREEDWPECPDQEEVVCLESDVMRLWNQRDEGALERGLTEPKIYRDRLHCNQWNQACIYHFKSHTPETRHLPDKWWQKLKRVYDLIQREGDEGWNGTIPKRLREREAYLEFSICDYDEGGESDPIATMLFPIHKKGNKEDSTQNCKGEDVAEVPVEVCPINDRTIECTSVRMKIETELKKTPTCPTPTPSPGNS